MSLSNDTYSISGGREKAVGGAWLSSVRARLHDLRAYWAVRQIRAREMQELNCFSDRELWDVGLSRSDLLSIEQGTYRRD